MESAATTKRSVLKTLGYFFESLHLHLNKMYLELSREARATIVEHYKDLIQSVKSGDGRVFNMLFVCRFQGNPNANVRF